MRRLITPLVMLAAAGVVVVVAAYAVAANVSAGRADCPGKIVCPQTGQLICRDQCPTIDPHRPDCPGRIECPLTGELVCADRCPLGTKSNNGGETPPSCCSGGK